MASPFQPLGRCLGARTGLVSITLALGLVGCATGTYRPTVPMRAQSEDVKLELKELHIGVGQELVLESQSKIEHEVRRGWLTVATRGPCAGGAEVEWISVDRGTIPASTLPPGLHQLRVKLNRHSQDLWLDLVLDMEIEKGKCLRTPVLNQTMPLTAEKRFTLVTSYFLDGNSDLSGLRAVTGIRLGVGSWLGPVLFTGQVGVGGTICNAQTCGKDQDGSLKGTITFPVALDARYKVSQFGGDRMTNLFQIGARYAYWPIRLTTLDGDRRFSVHGFHGVLSWAFSDAHRGPFLHPERTSLYEVSIPLGIALAPGAPGEKVGFSAGMDLRFLFPL
jgi:hypothetical protein